MVDKLTVPSSIFNSACWTPSPETSLLRLMLSAWNALQAKLDKKKGKMYEKCLNDLTNKPSLLFYQLHQYRQSLAEQQLRQNQQPRVQKRKVIRLAEATIDKNMTLFSYAFSTTISSKGISKHNSLMFLLVCFTLPGAGWHPKFIIKFKDIHVLQMPCPIPSPWQDKQQWRMAEWKWLLGNYIIDVLTFDSNISVYTERKLSPKEGSIYS